MARYRIAGIRGEGGIGVGIEKVTDEFKVIAIWSLYMHDIPRNAAIRRALDIVAVDSRGACSHVYVHRKLSNGGTCWHQESNIYVKPLTDKHLEGANELARAALRRENDIHEVPGT